ncbi:MAG: hypothetical protein ACR2J6_03620 [Thermoleophilaceae bacterium]
MDISHLKSLPLFEGVSDEALEKRIPAAAEKTQDTVRSRRGQ